MARNNKSAQHDQCLLLLLALVSSCVFSSYTAATEGEILLKFKNSLSDTSALDATWVNTTIPCNGTLHWTGVLCDRTGRNVFGLQLQNMGLSGLIDIDTLTELPALQTVSFMNNNFAGPMPDVKRLSLISVYLSQNKFTGDIPDDAFSGMGGTLRKVYLAENGFTGKIPSSLVALPKLNELDLGDNQFSGKIPDFQPRNWVMLNLVNNRFEGPIPPSLSNLPPADFEGNSGLCGKPLSPCELEKKKTSDGQRVGAVHFYQNFSFILVILYVGM